MNHNIGDIVIIIANECYHGWKMGAKVVVDFTESKRPSGYSDRYMGHAVDCNQQWYFYEGDCEALMPKAKYHPSGKLIET